MANLSEYLPHLSESTSTLDEVTAKGNVTTNDITVGSVTATSVLLGDWTIKLSGTELRFNYNGTDVFKIESSGAITGTGDVTANGAV